MADYSVGTQRFAGGEFWVGTGAQDPDNVSNDWTELKCVDALRMNPQVEIHEWMCPSKASRERTGVAVIGSRLDFEVDLQYEGSALQQAAWGDVPPWNGVTGPNPITVTDVAMRGQKTWLTWCKINLFDTEDEASAWLQYQFWANLSTENAVELVGAISYSMIGRLIKNPENKIVSYSMNLGGATA